MLQVYIKDGCPYCRKQMDEFDKQKLRYEVYNVSRDPVALKRAKEEFKADKVPVVVEGGRLKAIGYQGAG